MRTLILNKEFEAAKNQSINRKDLSDKIMEWASKCEDFVFYEFIDFLIHSEYETAQLNILAADLLINFFSHLKDSYEKAFLHVIKALSFEPDNIDFIMYLLFFNRLPSKLLSDKDASEYANKILLRDSNNKAALVVKYGIKKYLETYTKQ